MLKFSVTFDLDGDPGEYMCYAKTAEQARADLVELLEVMNLSAEILEVSEVMNGKTIH